MKKHRSSWMAEVFLEYLMASLAEGLVMAVGWCIRKALKWWKQSNDPEKSQNETDLESD